jgi:glycine/D-amino acid oxidase-like deaminating enzyme
MILGCHPELKNFYFANGFSGHGLQQAPATGRALSELIIYGAFRSLDLSPFCFERILENKPFLEKAIV